MQTFRFLKRVDGGILLAAVLSLFAVQALLKPGLPASADLIIHMYRTMEFEQAWAPGVIVPRWAPNLAYGYGYPLFVFAPPLPYLLGLLLQLPGLSIEAAFKILIIAIILLYAIGMYLLARDLLHSVAAGLIAATAYALAPFALREALLYGGNVPQFLAIGLFPWALWAATRAALTGGWGWTVLAGMFYAGVMLSHLFQVLIFTPVFGAYLLLVVLLRSFRVSPKGRGDSWAESPHPPTPSPKGRRGFSSPPLGGTEGGLSALLAIPIGLLLTAFFWLPVLAERRFTRAETGDFLEKSPFFVRYPHWSELIAWIQPLDFRAANPHVPLTLGVVTLGLAALGLVYAGLRLWQLRNERRSPLATPALRAGVSVRHASWPFAIRPIAILFFALVAAAGIFMSLPISRPIWETVEILQVAEFPWRMLGVANLGLAVVAGAAILLIPPKIRGVAAAVCLALQLWAVAPYLYPTVPFADYGQLTIADQIQYERSSQSIGTTTLGEYLPVTVTRPPNTSPLVDAFRANTYPERLDRASLPAEANATLLEQNATTHRYQVTSPAPFILHLYQFDYPGWQAALDGQPVDITPEAETGLMLIDVPAGQHELTVSFEETAVRASALLVSGVTIIGLLGFWSIKGWRRLVDRLATRILILKNNLPGLRRTPLNPPARGGSQTSPPSRGRLGGGLIKSHLNQPPTHHAPRTTDTASEQRWTPTRPRLNWLPSTIAALLITAAALWLKPLLQPLFTIHSPRDQALPAQHPADTRFANGIQLIGYDLSRRVAQPGDYVQVVLYWQTDSAPYRVNLQPFVHLDRLDNFTTIAGATNYTPGDVTTEMNMPTFHWDNARYIRDEHDLIIPPDTPPLAYAVRVGLINIDEADQLVKLAGDNGDTAWIDTINIAPDEQPGMPLAQPLDVTFHGENGDAVRLAGYEITNVTPEQLDFKLAWQADQPLEANYTAFAQLLDSDQSLVASFDRPPLDGAYPTSLWLPGQMIIDPRHVPLEGVPPGEFTLIIGLYDAKTGQRLQTEDGQNFVALSKVGP